MSTVIDAQAPRAQPAPCPRPDHALVRTLGMVEYEPTWRAMQDFTAHRNPDTRDELWIVEHPPVFTVGLNGQPEHLLRWSQIPVVKIDRGGQITYHGPGQVLVYLLLDLRRRGYGIRALVRRMERAVVHLLAESGVQAEGRVDAPGVYVDGAKIAALGLRVRNGSCYHGLALNVDLDLAPFADINPCGYAGLKVTRTRDLGLDLSVEAAGRRLSEILQDLLDRPEPR